MLFVVSVGAALTTLSALLHPAVFTWVISVWLWLTVVFANLAEAVAEGRGKAQAESLRRARTDTVALRLLDWRWGTNLRSARAEAVAATDLKPLDVVLVEAGEMIPADGDVVDGVAAVDESAVTGESAPVIRESGGDRSGVTGGTTVLSDRIVVRVSARPGHSFLDRMIALVEGANRQKTPNEIALEWVQMYGGQVPSEARHFAHSVAAAGGTPLLVAVHDWNGPRVLGLIHLKDVVKDGIRERFAELRSMGIRTVMITGDNPLTARAIAQEAGVDDYLAEATPEDKLALIKREQEGGKLVAMTGDGTNDAPALAQADVGVAMNTGNGVGWGGAYYDRDERVDPAPAATEDRTVRRLNKLADLLVGRTA